MPQLFSINRILLYRQGGYFPAGFYIIHISEIIYDISHFAVHRSKFSTPLSRKNIPRECRISKPHFAFYGRKQGRFISKG